MHKVLSVLLVSAGLVSCLPANKSAEVLNSERTPAECKGGEFAIPGFNQAKPPQCLDVTHYPVLRYFSDGAEYQRIAERFKMAKVLEVIAARGVSVAQQEYALVANLKHDNEFWVAQIPLTRKVTRTVFQVSEFRIPLGKALDAIPEDTRKKIEALAKDDALVAKELAEIKSGVYTAAHGQLRLAFSEPIVLAAESNPEKRTSLAEMILSVHAVSPGAAPDTYDPIKGFQNEYGTALGVYSLQDKAYQAIERHMSSGKDPSLVRQYVVNVSPAQADAVMRNYFERAKPAWDKLAYNTALRNCGSEIFESLDAVTGFKRDAEPPLSVLGRQYPKYAQYALLSRGFMSLRAGEKPDAAGGFQDSQLQNPMLSLNQELGFPEPR